MKKSIYTIMILSAAFFSACNMEDIHKEFIVPGGITYPQKADGLTLFEGKNKVRLQWVKGTDPKVVKARVYWNNYTDSVNVDIPATGSTVSVDINNLSEDTYTFFVRTYDAKGNESVVSEVTGQTYGDLYQATLNPRRLTKMEANDDADMVELNWGAANSAAFRFVLKYRTTSGGLRELAIPSDEEQTVLTDHKPGGDFSTETYYLPTPTALDTFVVTENGVFPAPIVLVSQSQFTVVSASSEIAPHFKERIIDDDLTTIWISDYSGAGVPPPHWLVIDLGASLDIGKIKMYQGPDAFDMKTVQLSLGDDPNPNAATWRRIGELIYPNGPPIEKSLYLGPEINTDGRYLKLYFPDSNRYPYVHFAEIYIYVRL